MKNIIITLLTLCFVGMCSTSYAQRGYAKAQEERVEQQQRDNRYHERQNKLYDIMDLQETESEYKYNDKRREQDIERRQKKIDSGDYSNDRRNRNNYRN